MSKNESSESILTLNGACNIYRFCKLIIEADIARQPDIDINKSFDGLRNHAQNELKCHKKV